MSSQTHDELLRQIEASPFDVELRQKFAEWLIAMPRQDQARGELIRAQCLPGDERDYDLIARLINTHGRRWIAEDLGINEPNLPPEIQCEFYQGFAWWPVKASASGIQPLLQKWSSCQVDSRLLTSQALLMLDHPISFCVKLVLCQPRRNLPLEQAIHLMSRSLRLSCNPDQLLDLCALRIQYPNLLFRIVAPGAVSYFNPDIGPEVLFSGHWDSTDHLRLHPCAKPFNEEHRFLGTRSWFIAQLFV